MHFRELNYEVTKYFYLISSWCFLIKKKDEKDLHKKKDLSGNFNQAPRYKTLNTDIKVVMAEHLWRSSRNPGGFPWEDSNPTDNGTLKISGKPHQI